MSIRSRWLGLSISLLIVLSMALVSFATVAGAAGVKSAAHKPAAKQHATKKHAAKKAAAKCTKRNRASGSVNFSDWEFPDTLNPAQAGLFVDALVTNGTFDALYGYNNKGRIFPQMATAIPTVKNGGVSKNARTWTVHLKPGLRWSNGQPLTAADIVFSWKAAMSPDSGPYCLGSCDVISRIDTPNSTTLVFHMKHPYSPALDYAINGFPLIPQSWGSDWSKGDVKAAVSKFYGDANFNYEDTKFPTNGAYQVTQFVNNDRIVLTPMKYYADMNCGAYLSTVRFAFYSNKDAMIAAATRHETDITNDYTLADLSKLKAQKSNFTTTVVPGFYFEHLEFNTDATYNGKPNPLHNANVRVALALALDKSGLVQSALGIGASQAKKIVAYTPLAYLPSYHFAQPYAAKQLTGQWDPVAKKFVTPGTPKAVADAKKLLASTPYKSGFTLDGFTTTGNPTRQTELSVAQANWQKIGVTFKPNYVPAATFFTSVWDKGGTLDHGNFQVADFAYVGKPDPDQFKFNLVSRYCDRKQKVHNVINGNNACISDKLINTAFKKAASTLNKKVRNLWYQRMQVELNKMAYWIPLYYRVSIQTTDGKVANFSGNPTQLGMTWNIYDWKLKS